MNKFRPTPEIPDHEVLRKIGVGAYGEIWMARGVTGALRAVKTVWREDFEDEREFEREFEGVLKYEPVSRDHPNLVHILHVGRGKTEGDRFYYYVMELGDDIISGGDINPAEYESRTLRSDMKTAKGRPLPLESCIDYGRQLSLALNHLHEAGLTHRDVKPANIIFIDGRPKLADVGLVAHSGQHTFVGTEGFVAPEGPGSKEADVYSLGKVLYEMATGKDRMDFPELPEMTIAVKDRKKWRQLNQVICDICHSSLSKRTVRDAKTLAQSLDRLSLGKNALRVNPAKFIQPLVLLALVFLISWMALLSFDEVKRRVFGKKEIRAMSVKVLSHPDGARVVEVDEDGKILRNLGSTPTELFEFMRNQKAYLKFSLPGYETMIHPVKIPMKGDLFPVEIEMKRFSPPIEGLNWEDALGAVYAPVDQDQVSVSLVTKEHWDEYLRENPEQAPPKVGEISEYGTIKQVVVVDPNAARHYLDWLKLKCVEEGFLLYQFRLDALFDPVIPVKYLNESSPGPHDAPFYVKVTSVKPSDLLIKVAPTEAVIYIDDISQGESVGQELLKKGIMKGDYVVRVEAEGFLPQMRTVTVKEGELFVELFELEENKGVIFGRSWENSLGSPFVPVEDFLLVSRWETKVGDYKQFVKQSQKAGFVRPAFDQEENHPVVNVTRNDATAYCEWLTKKERQEGRIGANHRYRLPTDQEWSFFAGLEREEGSSPYERELNKSEVNQYSWGLKWPPLAPVENIADLSAARTSSLQRSQVLGRYLDRYPQTAPVGSYVENQFGLFDIGGNVSEWVSSNYSPDQEYGVTRGGSWRSSTQTHLDLSSRNVLKPGRYGESYGFRIVLERLDRLPESSP